MIAFQEVVDSSLEFMKKAFPEYYFIGQLRSKNYDGEGLYVAVLKNSWGVLGVETIWLSPTPHLAGSKSSEESGFPRICTMTQIRNKNTGEVLRIYNVHLDYMSDEVALLEVKKTLEFMEEYERKISLPSILLGDFNFEPNSKTIGEVEKYQKLTDVTKNISHTFHDFGREKNACKIDYIFVSDVLVSRVIKTETWTECHEGIYLSDHYPVCMLLKD